MVGGLKSHKPHSRLDRRTVQAPAMLRSLSLAQALALLMSVALMLGASVSASTGETEFTATNPHGGRWQGHISEFHEDMIAWKGIEYVAASPFYRLVRLGG